VISLKSEKNTALICRQSTTYDSGKPRKLEDSGGGQEGITRVPKQPVAVGERFSSRWARSQEFEGGSIFGRIFEKGRRKGGEDHSGPGVKKEGVKEEVGRRTYLPSGWPASFRGEDPGPVIGRHWRGDEK